MSIFLDFGRLVFSLGICLCLFGSTQARVDSTLIKTYNEPDGYKLRLYSDGRDVVTVIFDGKEQVVDCDFQKGNVTLVASIFHDAITKETAKQFIETTDVRLVGRACRRFIRKVLRWSPSEEDPSNFKEAKKRQQLHKGVPGTAWCSLHGYATWRDNDVEDPSTDRCCKNLHQCNNSIPGFSYQDYHYNTYAWPLPHCTCSEAFHSCLSSSKGHLAKEVGDLYFNVLKLRCFKYEDKDVCASWNVWFNKCNIHNQTKVAILNENKAF